MSQIMERIRRMAAAKKQRLIFAEANDERIVAAAAKLARDQIAHVTLIGSIEEARATARKADVNLGSVELIESGSEDSLARTRAALKAARGERLGAADLEKYAADPVFQAAARVRDGLGDCFVAGASRTMVDVLRAALWLIGLRAGVKSVSSFFLMVLPGEGGKERLLTFADCAVLPDPTPEQLAEIAVLSAEHHQKLTQEVPHVAMLSFSTRGSAEHPHVVKVREATALAKALRPEFHIDGELQLDAAIVPSVGQRKAKDSVVAGHANVLVFPDLDAGNIGYKLAQRLGNAAAIGPMLQGLAKQANDLSRGCSVEEVVDTATVACVLAAGAL
ncbi:MAG: phosphotransacetylase [Candidatus Eisenbacteria bacterium]|nr:phosphotransacetylase [Candidatus Eisenbacteria bacterium]